MEISSFMSIVYIRSARVQLPTGSTTRQTYIEVLVKTNNEPKYAMLEKGIIDVCMP